MSQVQFADKAAVDAALGDVRSDKTPTNWALFGYVADAKNPTIEFVASGNDGINELVSHLKDDQVYYGLVRVSDVIDNSTTTKFVFIQWVGEKVKGLHKARITTHTGSIRNFIGQFHVDIYASNTNELSEQIIMDRVTDASGSGSRVLNESMQKIGAASKGNEKVTPGAPAAAGGGDLSFGNKDELQTALDHVRGGVNDTNWTLFGLEGNTNTLVHLGSGTGGLPELVNHLEADKLSYGLVRVIDVIDDHPTTKFVLIVWVGESVPAMRKARTTTFVGHITSFIGQHHLSVNASQHDELDETTILQRVKDASGSGSRVLAAEQEQSRAADAVSVGGFKSVPARKHTPAPAATTTTVTPKTTSSPATTRVSVNTSKPATTSAPRVNTTSQGLNFTDVNQLKQALADVRSDANPANWVAFHYDAPNSSTIALLGTGSGGIEELRSHLKNDEVIYALLRGSDVVDGHTTVKFVLVWWIPDKVPVVRKARIATHKGAITDLIGQYHTDISVATLDEITEDIVQKKIQAASGTAIHVK